MKTFRHCEIERDEEGMPVALHLGGVYELPPQKMQAEIDAEKLAEHERIYGRRSE